MFLHLSCLNVLLNEHINRLWLPSFQSALSKVRMWRAMIYDIIHGNDTWLLLIRSLGDDGDALFAAIQTNCCKVSLETKMRMTSDQKMAAWTLIEAVWYKLEMHRKWRTWYAQIKTNGTHFSFADSCKDVFACALDLDNSLLISLATLPSYHYVSYNLMISPICIG